MKQRKKGKKKEGNIKKQSMGKRERDDYEGKKNANWCGVKDRI